MAKAKAKATPNKEVSDTTDETIKRSETKESKVEEAPSVPPVTNVEKTESFTAAFRNDAHSAADYFLKHNTDNPEELKREDSDAGNEGVRVTITYK